MNINAKEIFTAGMILFAVIDIIGNIPIIISLRKKVGHLQSGKASIVSCIIMIGFLFLGEDFFDVRILQNCQVVFKKYIFIKLK